METIYYSDELNDDFSKAEVNTKELPPDFTYIPTKFKRVIDNIFYYCFAVPFVYLYEKIVFSERVVNRKALKPYRKTGYYLYGNHTRMAGDAFCPSTLTFPKKAYIITNADSVSIPFVKGITKALGVIPLPNDLKGMRKFKETIDTLSENNQVITIYPEAHIWPYYTKIRPFKDGSFRYPAENNKPVFTFTTTYHKRKWRKKPKTVVYIDGPFFNDPQLNVVENRKQLHQKAIDVMNERSKLSDMQYIEYVKIDK